jgi:16S rRNA pseudouridine516 synthase
MAKMRLDKFLKDIGIASRSELKDIIRSGRVTLNGAVCRDAGQHIAAEADVIAIDGQPVQYQAYVYLMMNKPKGVITATEDNRIETVIDLLPEKYRRMGVFPVGRLDRDTEGLLLITNNGNLAHNLLSPKKHVVKLYEAVLDRYPGEEAIEAFKKGVVISDDFIAMPAVLRYLSTEDPVVAQVEVFEGKFHQVKRMFKAVGATVVALKRLRMGEVALDASLKPGEFRELTETERKALGAE